MSAKLNINRHGKGRVRVVKVTRLANRHLIKQFTAWILIEGPVDEAFTTGNNAKVLPTDTVKNTTYALAKKHDFKTIEEFAIIVGRHLVENRSQIINKAEVHIVEDHWDRIVTKDSNGVEKEHSHAFVGNPTEARFTTAVVTKSKSGGQPSVSLSSGLKKLRVMKTTQSGFVKFFKDEYTTLPEVDDRLFGTEITATWRYNVVSTDFDRNYATIRSALMDAFAGPADKGVYSPSVQFTLHEMAQLALKRCSAIDEITLSMPNIHNMPFDVQKFGFKNLHPHGEVFYPIDEPHGQIEATVSRIVSRL